MAIEWISIKDGKPPVHETVLGYWVGASVNRYGFVVRLPGDRGYSGENNSEPAYWAHLNFPTGKDDRVHPYGYCPWCFSPGVSRERRIDGNDKCNEGHVYPSSAAVEKPNGN